LILVERTAVPLKPPVWTWEVPAYLFTGGVAGISAVIALAAEIIGGDSALARDARYLALAAALFSPLLLISDLGRPWRFLYMLRVFKRQSAMSVGAWTLAAFGAAIAGSVLLRAFAAPLDAASGWLLTAIVTVCDLLAGLTGLVLVTYTGVLLGATAIPVWAANARVLPWLFTATSLGAAASLLELIGHDVPPLHALALIAAATETITASRTRGLPLPPASLRAGQWLAGPLALLLRLAVWFWPLARPLAALAAIAGAMLVRIGWIAAGRSSAQSTAA
jgi:formate-dependent nitrite reductase membrane component NrfD